MILQDFVKELFSQESVKGYELGRVEIDICIVDDKLYVGGDSPSAKISIVPINPNPEHHYFAHKVSNEA